MPVTYVWDGDSWEPIQGLPGAAGPAGPTGVSNDAGNQSELGSDSLIYTPEFADGVYLPLAGGTLTGDLSMGGNTIKATDIEEFDGNGLRLAANVGSVQVESTLNMGDNLLIGVAVLRGGSLGLNLVSSASALKGIDFSDSANTLFQMFDAGNWSYRLLTLLSGNVLGPNAGNSDTVLSVELPDGNGTRLKFMSIRDSAGSDHGSSRDAIVRQVDVSYFGGVSFARSDSKLYYQNTTSVPTGTTGTEVKVESARASIQMNGVQELLLTTTFFQVPNVYNGTTGSAANVNVDVTGNLARSTSARKYKSNIVEDPQLADLDLEPIRYHHDGDGKDYIGFIADDMPDPDAIVYENGEVEGYDLRAVVAILAAKVNQLENA